jgi:hypothetical protein
MDAPLKTELGTMAGQGPILTPSISQFTSLELLIAPTNIRKKSMALTNALLYRYDGSRRRP